MVRLCWLGCSDSNSGRFLTHLGTKIIKKGQNSFKKLRKAGRSPQSAKNSSKRMDHESFLGPLLEPRLTKILKHCHSKKHQKIKSRKAYFFDAIWAWSAGRISDFDAFQYDFGSPGASFSYVFLCFCFGLDLEAFFVKNVRKSKTRNVAFVS